MMTMMIWVWPLLLTFQSHGLNIDSIRENSKGVSEMKAENFSAARQKFLEALGKEPFVPEYKMNLGLSFEAEKETEKAIKEYQGALKMAQTPEQKFYAQFDIAQVYGAQKKIPQALYYYQKALDINPESIEVKTNIELLMKQDQGGGGGEGQDQQKDQKGQGNDQSQNKNDPKQDQNPQQEQKQKPKEFQSKELTKDDVRKILEELKNQEQSIRAQDYDKNPKESPNDKDW